MNSVNYKEMCYMCYYGFIAGVRGRVVLGLGDRTVRGCGVRGWKRFFFSHRGRPAPVDWAPPPGTAEKKKYRRDVCTAPRGEEWGGGLVAVLLRLLQKDR